MDIWAVLPPAGAPEYDPQQRFRPVLAGGGPEIAWHDDDGQVVTFDAVGFEVTAGGDAPALAGAPGSAAALHLTDRRVVLVAADVPEPGGHLTGQVDLMCLTFVRHSTDPDDDGAGEERRRRLEVGALTGEPGREVEILATTVAGGDVEAIAQGIHARARSVQARQNLRPLTPEKMDALRSAVFIRSADGARADFSVATVSMADLAVLAYPRRNAAPA